MHKNTNAAAVAALLLAANVAQGASPQHPAPPTSVADITLAKCTAEETLETVIFIRIKRVGDAADQSLKENDQMIALMDQLPKSQRPVGELMNPQQAAEFSRLSVQMRVHAMNDLAESEYERDARVMLWAVSAIEKLRADPSVKTLATKEDPGADGAALIGLMREAMKDTNYSAPPDPATGVCSVDLALFKQAAVSVAREQRLFESDELKQYMALRAKYHLAQGTYMDPKKLPSPDREKALWLEKAAVEPMQQERTAIGDWENLRLFAKVSENQYNSLREDILAGSGAPDYNYNKSTTAAYAAANPPTKAMMNVWTVINKNIPSEQEKNMKQLAEIAKGKQETAAPQAK